MADERARRDIGAVRAAHHHAHPRPAHALLGQITTYAAFLRQPGAASERKAAQGLFDGILAAGLSVLRGDRSEAARPSAATRLEARGCAVSAKVQAMHDAHRPPSRRRHGIRTLRGAERAEERRQAMAYDAKFQATLSLPVAGDLSNSVLPGDGHHVGDLPGRRDHHDQQQHGHEADRHPPRTR